MNPVDEFINRVTERLRPDRELAAEVAAEMKSHIEDAVEEGKISGMGEEEALQQAFQRFGDPRELADQLWKANLRRMKLRSLGKWAFRLVATPAAVLLAVLLLWDGLDVVVYARYLRGLGDSSLLANLPDFGGVKLFRPELRSSVSEKDSAAYEALTLGFEDTAERWVELFPDKPMFHANRIIEFLYSAPRREDSNGNIPEEVIREGVALADKGGQLDPDNAFFNYIKASLLMHLSGAAKLGWSPLPYSYESPVGEWDIYPLLVSNDEMFQEGLAEFREGAAKPRCDSYFRDIQEYLLSLERPPVTFLEVTQRVMEHSPARLPHLNGFVGINKIVVAYAGELVDGGNHKDAAELLAIAPVPGTQLGQTPDIYAAICIAGRMRSYALYGGAVLYERMGMHNASDVAKREADINTDVFDSSFHMAPGSEREEYEQSVQSYAEELGKMIFSAIRVDDASLFKHVRMAERAVVESTALGIVAFIFLAEILVLSSRSLLESWRGLGGPLGVSIGWRRVAFILLAGVIVPVAAYAAFTRTSLGSARFSMSAVPERAFLELGAAMTAVLVLVNVLGIRAVRIRTAEVGIGLPRRILQRALAWQFLLFLSLCSLGMAIAWNSICTTVLIGISVASLVLLAYLLV